MSLHDRLFTAPAEPGDDAQLGRLGGDGAHRSRGRPTAAGATVARAVPARGRRGARRRWRHRRSAGAARRAGGDRRLDPPWTAQLRRGHRTAPLRRRVGGRVARPPRRRRPAAGLARHRRRGDRRGRARPRPRSWRPGSSSASRAPGSARSTHRRRRSWRGRWRPAHPGPRVAGALVVDLSSLWAGPLCAQLLTAAGARTVKVESTSRPDGARRGPAPFYDLLHAGQDSVALDFRDHRDVDRLRTLLAAADIVIEASRPRALAQLGIDAAGMRRGGLGGVDLDHRLRARRAGGAAGGVRRRRRGGRRAHRRRPHRSGVLRRRRRRPTGRVDRGGGGAGVPRGGRQLARRRGDGPGRRVVRPPAAVARTVDRPGRPAPSAAACRTGGAARSRHAPSCSDDWRT